MTGLRRCMLAIAAVCAAAMFGCSTAGRSYMVEIAGDVWDGPVTVEIPNTDTTTLCDLRIALRHDGSAEGRRIEMTVRTVTPDSLWIEEPLSVTVGDDGRSRSLQHETQVIYRRRALLRKEGCYRMTLTPVRAVRGVTAAGVDIVPGRNDAE